MKKFIGKLYISLLTLCCLISSIGICTMAVWSIHDGYLQNKHCGIDKIKTSHSRLNIKDLDPSEYEEVPKFEDTTPIDEVDFDPDAYLKEEKQTKYAKTSSFESNQPYCTNGVLYYKFMWGDADFATNPIKTFLFMSFLWLMLPLFVYLLGMWVKWLFKR